jgi:hypothetical protein
LIQEKANTFRPEDTRPLLVLFQDEGRFGRIQIPRKCWAPKGMRPVVFRQEVREYTYVYLAVCPESGETISLILPYVDTECMNQFLQEVSEQYRDFRVIMVLDGAGWHASTGLEEFDNIRLLFLPPYSPELNPAEHLWRYLREEHIRNSFWRTIDELVDSLVTVLHHLISPNETVRSLTAFHWTIPTPLN